MDTISYIAASSPLLAAIIFYIYLVLRNNKRFGFLLLKSYFAGAASTLMLILTLYIGQMIGMNSFSGLEETLIYAFVFIGFGSELGKFFIFRFYILNKPEVDTPIHAMAFSVMVALGFSTVTVILFVLGLFDNNLPFPQNMYLLLAAPSNIIFAVVMGFFVGMSKFVESKFSYALFGLIGATFFNGLFKFCLITHDYKLLNLFAFGAALVVMVLIIKAVNHRP